MGRKTLLKLAVSLTVIAGGGVAYASIFGEENITLVQQLSELMGISRNTYDTLREAKEGVLLAREAADDVQRAKALVEDLQSYTTDRFINDFQRDVLQTYPDLDTIIKETGSGRLYPWRASNMRSPMSSYDLIGRVFGEATKDVRRAQKAGEVSMEEPTLYRYEAATSLAVAEDASQFVDRADADIEALVEQLSGATKEEAIVLQAKLSAVMAAQSSHTLRLLARLVRRDGVEDARRYQQSMNALATSLQVRRGQEDIGKRLGKRPKFVEFDQNWLELE